MAVLQQVFGDPPLPWFPILDDITTIGRHDDCNVVVPSPAVSRFHARITCENDRFFVEDLSSRNGTLLNGQLVRKRTLLNDGDQVEFSTLPYMFVTQNSLSEASGSWGVRAKVICVSDTGSDNEDSIRRKIVSPGDRITNNDLGTDIVREGQVVNRMSITGDGAWPVLTDATQKLNHVLRMVHGLRQTIVRNEVISCALQNLFEVFDSAERIAVVLRDEHGSGIEVAAAVSRRPDEEIQICLPVVRSCMQNTEAMLYVDHWKGNSSGNVELENPTMRSIMCVPLVGLIGHSIGAIQIDNKNARRPLDKDNLEQLVVISQVISFALEQAVSAEAEVRRAVMETNIASAERLRFQLSPATLPELSGFRVAHEVIAAPDIVADLVDYVRLPDGRLACLLLDVAGRGRETTNLMGLVSRLLIGAITETGSACETIRLTEIALLDRLEQVPMVISVAVMILDPQRSAVTVSVAGHCPLALIQLDNVTEIDSSDAVGPPLGAGRDSCGESEFQLNDDDVFLMFSDGITKLMSPAGEILSQLQKVELIRQAVSPHPSAIETKLLELLISHRGDAPLVDDVAFVIVHRNGMAETAVNPDSWASGSETQEI